MIKHEKKRWKLQFSIFWKIFAPLEAKMMKNEKAMIKNDKNEKKSRKIAIFNFLKMFAPLEAKMMNKLKKMLKNDKKSRKIAVFHFLENFCTTGSKNDETWKNNDKHMIRKMKKTRGKLQFSI